MEPTHAPTFDITDPPEQQLIDDCVHCGFCLPTCPTYLLWGEEMDSPRGRINLMEQGLAGEPLSPEMVSHFDACLGCMACVTACPSGVAYDKLINATRTQVERHHERPAGQRLLREAIFALFPYPRRLRAMRGPLRAYQRSGLAGLVERSGLLERLSPQLATMATIAPAVGGPRGRPPEQVPARGQRRAVIGMLTGCVQSVFFPDVNAATARVLAAEGCDVVVPPRQGCCGALSMHTGRQEEAQRFARHTIETFERAGVDAIVVNAAGCGSAMKEYAHLLRNDPQWAGRAEALSTRVRDFSELLADLEPVAPRHPLPLRLAYQDACHLSHAQGIWDRPRSLLKGIPELDLVEITEPEICCGSAGVYNLLEPEPARELGDRKAATVLATGADVLATANPGCLMQINAAIERVTRNGHEVPRDRQEQGREKGQGQGEGHTVAPAHVAEVLDASIRGLSAAALTRQGQPPRHRRGN